MFEDYYQPEFNVDYFNSPAFQRAIAAAVEQYSPAPVEPVYYAPPPEPVYYAPEPVAGIGRSGEYDYYQPELQVPEVYAEPAPVEPVYYAPPPEPVYYAPESVAGIGGSVEENYYTPEVQVPEVYTPAPEPVYTPAVAPMTVEAEPIMGIGSPVVAAPAEASSVIETALAARAAGEGLTQEQSDALQDRRAAANELPPGTYLAAPTGGRGEMTGFDATNQKANVFQYRGGPVRVVDGKGNVLFSGEGAEGAVAAARFAQNLSDTKGTKATWDLQEGERTINPDGSVGPTRWVSGPSTRAKGMGTIGDLAAFLLPVAAAIAAGPLGLAAQVAMGAAAGAAGAVMSGNDPLKAALIAGASAGIMNVSGANEAISGTLNKISGTVANEAVEKAVEKAGEELAEQIVVTGTSRILQGAGSAIGNTLLSETAKAGLGEITGFETPAERFAEEQLPETLQTPAPTPVEDTIVVTGDRLGAVADTAADVITGIGSSAANTVINQPTATEPNKTAEEIEEEKTGDIVSLGEKAPSVNVPVPGIGTPGVVDPVTGDIVVSKPRPEPESVTKEPDLPVGSVLATLPITGLPTPDPALTDQKSTLEKIGDVADVVSAVLPIVGGVVGGGGGDGGTISPDTTGLKFTKSTLRPTLTGAGIGGVGGNYPYTPQTYGRAGGNQETEYLFFTKDPVTGEPAVAPVVPAAAPGKKEGGEIHDDMVKHLVEYHKNGGHQGPGQVKGIGSGQEDKIPAWLSDGEYVWSAQDVADLGDGSTDEGVRRLDKMRQMVRRQAGRKDVKKIAKPQKGIDTMLKAVGGLV